MAFTPGSQYSLPYRLLRRFGWQPMIDADFTLGIVRDMPLSSIPAGGCYDSTDWLLDQVGVLRKRGGSAYQSNALGATTTGVSMVACPEYPSGAKVVALAADGHLYDATAASNVDAGVLGVAPVENPGLHVDKLILCASNGTTAPKKATAPGGVLTVANLGGSPPAGMYSANHISRLVLASSAANPNRVWFSPVPDIEAAWDTANSYIDTNHNLTAIASIQGVLCCFSLNHVERITGSIPPAANETNDNMALQALGEVGCVDARSIVPWNAYLVFAAQDGIWITNGAGVQSLTEEPRGYGIKSYWRTLYATAAANGASISAGIYNRDYYHLSIVYGSTLVDHLVCYLPRKTWWRLTNLRGVSFATTASGLDELYMGVGSGTNGNRVVKLSGLYNPSSSNRTDHNGTAVTPVLTTRNMGVGVGLSQFGHGHLHYKMVDGGETPTMKVEVGTGLGAATFTQPAESPFPAATNANRRRFNCGKDSQGLTVRITQQNASSVTEVYGVELEQRNYNLANEVPVS